MLLQALSENIICSSWTESILPPGAGVGVARYLKDIKQLFCYCNASTLFSCFVLFSFFTEIYTFTKVLFTWFFVFVPGSTLKLMSCSPSWRIYLRELAIQHNYDSWGSQPLEQNSYKSEGNNSEFMNLFPPRQMMFSLLLRYNNVLVWPSTTKFMWETDKHYSICFCLQ